MDTPQGHPALESVMLLIVADFMPKSAIFDGLAPVSARTSFGKAGRKVAAGWQTSPMKSTIVECEAYAHLRAAPLLERRNRSGRSWSAMLAGQPWLLARLTG